MKRGGETMLVEKISKKKASTVVVEQIEKMIEEGYFKAGDKLPSVRELCDLFDVGRSTIRDALITLNGKGTVYVKQGEGTYVCDFDSAPLFHKSVLMPNEKNIQELFQVRRILEAGIAKEAALFRSQADLSKLKAALLGEKEEWELDYDFHMAIAHATKNDVIVQFMEFIADTLKRTMIDFHEQIKRDDRIVKLIEAQHHKIYEAIRDGVPFNAYEAMVTHLLYVEKLLHQYFPEEIM